jgi:hypothetical protein
MSNLSAFAAWVAQVTITSQFFCFSKIQNQSRKSAQAAMTPIEMITGMSIASGAVDPIERLQIKNRGR